MHIYRPQRSWAKVMFLQASVILSTGGCLPQCMLGYHHTPPEQTPPRETPPPRNSHPLEQTPPRADTPPGSRHTPRSRHPPEQTPPGVDTPLEQTPPPEQTPPQADTPPEQTPPRSMLRHTVNERPVRILLECILVVLNFLNVYGLFFNF